MIGPAKPSENDDLGVLVASARDGDARAIGTLVVAVGHAMIQVIRKVLGARHPDVDDIFQEASLAFVQSLRGFRGECSAKSYACRIAAHKALTARRRLALAGLPPQPETPEDAAPADNGGGEHDAALASRRRDLFRLLLDELAEPQADTLVLHCVVGLTIQEVAETTHVPLETARSRLRLAKAALRARIATDPIAREILEDDP